MAARVLVAMSGGVDSAVAALLLQQQGYDVTGVTLRLWDNSASPVNPAEDARQTAEKLGIPHITLDRREAFAREVIDRFAASYTAGDTPNPCIVCNRYIKFGALMNEAMARGFDFLATGHYARIEQDTQTGRFALLKGTDAKKDQSYMLYALSQEVLAHTLFPLGGMHKDEIRTLAEAHGFVSATRRESQDICFVPDGDYARFLTEEWHQTTQDGNFVDQNGTVIGRHRGCLRYTIGQRKGLGMGFGKPQYVLQKRMEQNEVVLGDEPALFATTLLATDVNWVSVAPPTAPLPCTARARYSQTQAPATVTTHPDGTATVVFREPQRALTDGQAVVFYDGDRVLGGGTIRTNQTKNSL